MLKSFMPSDSQSSFVACSESIILALLDSVTGVMFSRVPASLGSVNEYRLTMLAVCVFAGEVCRGELEYVPGTVGLWHEVCETGLSGM